MTQRLAVIGGTGDLVERVLREKQAAGWTVRLFSMGADQSLARDFPLDPVSPGRPVQMAWKIRRFRPDLICMVGAVALSDRDRGGLIKAISMFGGKKHRATGGDAGLAKGIPVLEKLTGGRVVGVHVLLPDLLAVKGHVAGPLATAEELSIAQFALDSAYRSGQIDLGQSVVVSRQRVLAVEDIAGTQALIKRIAQHRNANLLNAPARETVLGKSLKPGQSQKVDMPTVGPDTLEQALAAGIGLIAVHADHTLIVEKEKFAEMANSLGVTILALEPNSLRETSA